MPAFSEERNVSFDPAQKTDHLLSTFIQNEFWLKPDKLRLTLGSKFEYNDYTGLETQPTVRLLWKLDQTKSVWAAISRAVRIPARSDETVIVQYTAPPPLSNLRSVGSSDIESETMVAYELGLHWKLSQRSILNINLFFNEYDQLRISRLSGIELEPIPTVYSVLANGMSGEIFGAEIATIWQVSDTLEIKANYTYMKTQLHLVDPADRMTANWEAAEGNDPNYQASINLLWSISPRWELDTSFYYVDDLANQNAPDYSRLDIRLGWQPHPDWRFSLGVRNAFDDQHTEYGLGLDGAFNIPSDIRRSAYVQVQWQY